MNNKEKLIKAMDNDFSKGKNLSIIYKKLDNSYMFNKRFKYAFVSSLILIFILLISFNKEDKNLNQNNTYNSDTNINTSQNIIINDVNIPIIKNDPWEDSIYPTKGVKYKIVKSIDGYNFYKDLNINREYNLLTMYEVYINNTELNNYVISYKDEKEDKDIEIAFSKENEPISNYEYKNINIKPSKINNVDVKIYKSDNIYISAFKYDNINFNITTCNLKQSELLDLLNLIIK